MSTEQATEKLPDQRVAKIEGAVTRVLSSSQIEGFERANLVANAIIELKSLLTPEYMKPIMAMQGNRLGFKVDKKPGESYPEEIVKNCLIEAVLTGVQPYGNQFNIIAGNCYITKEGFKYLLDKIENLTYDISFELPRIKQDNTSAAIVATITWNYSGKAGNKIIDFPVKMNSFMGADAVIGKAERKSRKWLYEKITGQEVGDGDVEQDFTEANVVGSKTHPTKEETAVQKEQERMEAYIKACTSISALDKIHKDVPDALIEIWRTRRDQLVEIAQLADKTVK